MQIDICHEHIEFKFDVINYFQILAMQKCQHRKLCAIRNGSEVTFPGVPLHSE